MKEIYEEVKKKFESYGYKIVSPMSGPVDYLHEDNTTVGVVYNSDESLKGKVIEACAFDLDDIDTILKTQKDEMGYNNYSFYGIVVEKFYFPYDDALHTFKNVVRGAFF